MLSREYPVQIVQDHSNSIECDLAVETGKGQDYWPFLYGVRI